MNRIVKIGMDVHSTNFNLCAVEPVLGGEPNALMKLETRPDVKDVISFVNRLKKQLGSDINITCGYEAGCLGFKLYHNLKEANINCIVLAPSTMAVPAGKRIKTDDRDAFLIAKCLCDGNFSAVHIPTPSDEEVRDYIRMQEDHKQELKKIKQYINALCLRHGYRYQKTKWNEAHLQWLHNLQFSELVRETLNEYLTTYYHLANHLETIASRIEELAARKEYSENVGKLGCFLGIKTTVALSVLVETGDFKRFDKGNRYAAYLGLVPGEHSSGSDINRLPITKAGNTHLRRLLIEAAQSICRGHVKYKSKALKARQKGKAPELIAYADKANERLRRKYYRLINNGKQRNVAVTAIARELACFIWGMMTNHLTEAGVA